MAGQDKLVWHGPFEGYEVLRDGKRVGWVTAVSRREWAANCKRNGCFCHWIYPTRREAVAALSEPPVYVRATS